MDNLLALQPSTDGTNLNMTLIYGLNLYKQGKGVILLSEKAGSKVLFSETPIRLITTRSPNCTELRLLINHPNKLFLQRWNKFLKLRALSLSETSRKKTRRKPLRNTTLNRSKNSQPKKSKPSSKN